MNKLESTENRVTNDALRGEEARRPDEASPPPPAGQTGQTGKVSGFIPYFVFLGKSKLLLTIGTMLLAIVLQSMAYGFPMGLGITNMIFVHELGHIVAGRLLHLPFQAMIFIPFLGAFVAHKGVRHPVDGAFLAILGPVFGGLFAFMTLAFYFVTHIRFWLFLAEFSFFINLLNLLPFRPLDGSFIAALFRKPAEVSPAVFAKVRPRDRRNYGIATGVLAVALLAGMFVAHHISRN